MSPGVKCCSVKAYIEKALFLILKCSGTSLRTLKRRNVFLLSKMRLVCPRRVQMRADVRRYVPGMYLRTYQHVGDTFQHINKHFIPDCAQTVPRLSPDCWNVYPACAGASMDIHG